MIGTLAPTDEGWYEFLRARPGLSEVNFWRPSARRAFRAPQFSPFLFKLRAPHSAVCGFGYFASYSALPIWLAWETFGQANGTLDRVEMERRVGEIRERIRYAGGPEADYIGCVLLVQPTFFPREAWIRQPETWKARTQGPTKFDLSEGEGRRVWESCLATARDLDAERTGSGAERQPRYGAPVLVRPRLGQGTFRIGVTDAYRRACAATGEHSLPALEAGHIQPYGQGGPHAISNGILLRADLHRLFDLGYLTIDPDRRIVVSGRLREEYRNGRTYYPLHGEPLRLPQAARDHPDAAHLAWHNENVFAA